MDQHLKRPEDLSLQEIEKILEIYQEILGPTRLTVPDPQTIHTEIQTISADAMFQDGYRVGSRWSVHSKLKFTQQLLPPYLPVGFNPSISYRSEEEKAEIERATREFYTKVEDCLRGKVE